MASIETNLETIRTAIYGKDMRQAIYEAIQSNHSDIVNVNSAAMEITASYIKYTLTGMFRGWSRTTRVVTGSEGNTLLDETPYYLIEAARFDPDNGDGLMIWKNASELVPPALYDFDKQTYASEGKIRIYFPVLEEDYFTSGDRVIFMFYKKPASSGGGVIGTARRVVSALVGDVIGEVTSEED